jgi:DNA repair protein SbcC/Rad50
VKIFEFHVIRYGPVNYKNPFALSDFTLFWGKNEQGKTLTIDALVKLLLGKETKRFDNINRVEGQPSGHVVITVGDKLVKLTAKETLTEVCGISEADCRNIFIVRASDLSIEKDAREKEKEKEADFYAALTDRLTGMETGRISRVRDALLSLARITPTGKFKDVKDEGLKARFETALLLTDEIARLSAEIEESGLDALEREAVDAGEEIERLNEELANMDDARKRKRYETGFAALEKLEQAAKAADDLARFRDEDERAWLKAEQEGGMITAEIAHLWGLSEKKQAELDKRTVELKAKERDFQVLEGRKRKIDEDVRPRLVDYEKRLGQNAENTQKKGFYTLVSAISAAVLCASLIAMILKPQMMFAGLAAAGFIATVVSIVLLARVVGGRARMERDFQEVRLDLARLELPGKTVPETLAAIQRFNEAYKKRLDEINGLRQERVVLEREVGNIISEAIPRQEQAAAAGGRVIADISRRSGCRTVNELGEKIAARRRAESAVSEQAGILSNRFEKGDGNLKEDIAFWRRKIAEFVPYRDKGVGVEFTERAYQEKQEAKRAAQERLAETSGRLTDFKKRLEHIQRQGEIVLAPKDDVILCETSVDLASIAGRLSVFVSEHEADRGAALTAVEIFNKIEAEERQQVSLLFGEDSAVSRYFSTITGGLYDAVTFDNEDGAVHVRSRDGSEFPADKLSSGAYDQLYLAIRLALGERLVSDGAGFFIMDDPFIRSDPERLARQMAMLSDIARKGWQVIYFSSKGEVKEALTKEIKKGAVTLFEL